MSEIVETETVTAVTKADLLALRALEVDGFKFNRAIDDEGLAAMDERLRLTVKEAWSHKQYDGPYPDVMRVQVLVNEFGKTIFVDMPIDFFAGLSTRTLEYTQADLDEHEAWVEANADKLPSPVVVELDDFTGDFEPPDPADWWKA